ncbi:MAG TPA: CSLREA domain-containing protein [Thermoleophilaceae bacterium]|nr:CSLREA domain-containing protein [Thermoleophilaceae bacterium]
MHLPLRPGALLGLAGAICLAPAAPALAATIGVNTTADQVATDGSCSLREALTAANKDSKGPGGDCAKGNGADTVKLGKGRFTLSIPGVREDNSELGDLDARSNVTIAGAGARATTIDAGGIDRVLEVLPGRIATITGVTVTGGRAPDGFNGLDNARSGGGNSFGGEAEAGESGGGIFNDSGNLTVVDSTVTGNVAGTGGKGGAGRAADGSSPASGDAGDAHIGFGGVGGSGGDGGGIFTTGVLTLTRARVTGNSAGAGGLGGVGTGGDGGSTPGGNGGKGGDGAAGIGGTGGSGGGIAERSGGEVVVGQSTIAGNQAGAGGTVGFGQGGTGGGSGPNVAGRSGGVGGSGSSGIGGSGGTGGGLDTQDPVVVVRSLIRGNVSGAGGATGSATGGVGGPSTGSGGHGGNGGAGRAGIAGDGGFGAGLAVPPGSTIVNDTFDGNRTGAGGPTATATGGKGGAAIETGGNGGDGGGGIAGGGGRGGAIWAQSGTLTVRHATIVSNALGTAGAIGTGVAGAGGGGATPGTPGSVVPGAPGFASTGGAVFSSGSTGSDPLTILNTIVVANDAPGCSSSFPGLIAGARDISLGDATCPGADVDPKLGALAANGGPTLTRALGTGSPAIDAVPAGGAGCATTDQRGVGRPNGPACEIGAYERAAPTVATGRASNIAPTHAKLHGRVNPSARSTAYHFEFGRTAAYGRSTRVKKLPPGTRSVGVSALAGRLKPRTTYHYRLVATNADGTRRGADHTFKTPRT